MSKAFLFNCASSRFIIQKVIQTCWTDTSQLAGCGMTDKSKTRKLKLKIILGTDIDERKRRISGEFDQLDQQQSQDDKKGEKKQMREVCVLVVIKKKKKNC
jgi:hypothetical protein